MPTLSRSVPFVTPRGGRRGIKGELRAFGGRLALAPAVLTVVRRSAYVFSGVSVDSVGAPLANCLIKLFRSSNDSLVDQTISSGVGAYSFFVGSAGPFYVVSFNASGTLAGVTLPATAV